ncbi:MAG TPA: hypothetical protein EYQ50_27815 [Verrucomicrobiales bacterium]|nr:hypothetical protein [Verrucomicrobiales bacterium]
MAGSSFGSNLVDPICRLDPDSGCCGGLLVLSLGKAHPWMVLLIGMGSVGSYLIILFAFQLALVGYVVALREFAVVIGACLGFYFLKETISPEKVFAIIIISLGLILIKVA